MTEWMNTDGSFGDMASAPEDIRTLAENKGFKSAEDIAKAYTNLEGMKGEWANPESMKLPENFSEEQLVTIHGKMGVPENTDGYKYDFGDNEVDTTLFDKFKTFASENKYTQDQFSGALDFYGSLTQEAQESMKAQLDESFNTGVQALKDAWGEEYETKAEQAAKFSVESGLSEIWEELGAYNNPKVVQKMFELSKMTEEDKLPNNRVIEKTKAEQIAELTSNPAYTDNMHPDHKAVLAKIHKLYGLTG